MAKQEKPLQICISESNSELEGNLQQVCDIVSTRDEQTENITDDSDSPEKLTENTTLANVKEDGSVSNLNSNRSMRNPA